MNNIYQKLLIIFLNYFYFVYIFNFILKVLDIHYLCTYINKIGMVLLKFNCHGLLNNVYTYLIT